MSVDLLKLATHYHVLVHVDDPSEYRIGDIHRLEYVDGNHIWGTPPYEVAEIREDGLVMGIPYGEGSKPRDYYLLKDKKLSIYAGCEELLP